MYQLSTLKCDNSTCSSSFTVLALQREKSVCSTAILQLLVFPCELRKDIFSGQTMFVPFVRLASVNNASLYVLPPLQNSGPVSPASVLALIRQQVVCRLLILPVNLICSFSHKPSAYVLEDFCVWCSISCIWPSSFAAFSFQGRNGTSGVALRMMCDRLFVCCCVVNCPKNAECSESLLATKGKWQCLWPALVMSFWLCASYCI